jgi:hypothetical protein
VQKSSADGPAIAAFTGEWRITGNYGEHFDLRLAEAPDGSIAGTYFAGKPGAYPKGDIFGGAVGQSGLLAGYRYATGPGQSESGEILFTLNGAATLTALWTNGAVVPSQHTAGGSWSGVLLKRSP